MASDLKMKKRDYRFFEFARRQAEQSDFEHIHIGAVAVYKGHIIGQGCNSSKSDPKQKRANQHRQFNYGGKKPIHHAIHAEVAAIKSIPYPMAQSIDWSKVNIYVYRICPGKDFGMGMARPCPGCMSELRRKGIENIYYTTDCGYAYERIF